MYDIISLGKFKRVHNAFSKKLEVVVSYFFLFIIQLFYHTKRAMSSYVEILERVRLQPSKYKNTKTQLNL